MSPIPSSLKKLIFFGIALLLAACESAEAASAPAPSLVPATITIALTPSFTPEPTVTPTPAPPTPLPRFFTEEFNGAIPAWAVLQSNGDSAPATRVQDGSLTFDLESPYQWAYAVLGVQEYGDVRVDAVLRTSGAGPEATGLICRYSEANGWYEFNVSGDGTYGVLFGQWLAEGVAGYAPIASDRSEYLQPGEAENEVGLTCQEDTLLLYINGKLFRKLDVSRFALKEGRVGLSIASFENTPVTASFDWVKVSKP